MTGRQIKWTDAAGWGAIGLCCLIAFWVTFAEWRQRLSVVREHTTLNLLLERQRKQQAQLEAQRLHVLHTLTAPEDGRESARFLALLQQMIQEAGLKQESVEPTTLSPLPTITPPEPETGTKSQSARSKDEPDAPSLAHLPLRVSALPTRLTVRGSFVGLHSFLRRVENARYNTRAISVNTLTVHSMESGSIQATLVLTRYVRPLTDDTEG